MDFLFLACITSYESVPASSAGTLSSFTNACLRSQLASGSCCDIVVQVSNAMFFMIEIEPFNIVSADCDLYRVAIKDPMGITKEVLCGETAVMKVIYISGNRFSIRASYNATLGSRFTLHYTANFTQSKFDFCSSNLSNSLNIAFEM